MTYACPKGHQSNEPDYCDTCGAAIAGAPAAASTSTAATPVPVAAPTGEPCPVCGTPRVGEDRFCENDGYDFATGRKPDPDPTLAAAQTAAAATPAVGDPGAAATANQQWTATVAADRAYYNRLSVEGVDFPAVCPERTFVLTGDSVRIGRRSASKGITPEIDLSGPPLDPGVSHLHLVLNRAADGWELVDPGSTNGASLNEAEELIEAQQAVPLKDGDRIHLGAWSTITVHAPS